MERMDIDSTVDEASLENIINAIDGISYKAPTLLKNALNATGKESMKQLLEGIAKRYAITSPDIDLQKSLTRVSATYANPRTIMQSSGPRNTLADFDVNPRRLAHGASRPKSYSGRTLVSRALEELEVNKQKPFLTKFDSGHGDIVVRVPGEKYTQAAKIRERMKKRLDLTKIAVLTTVATPQMMGVVYNKEVKEDEAKRLVENLRKEIKKFFDARDKK